MSALPLTVGLLALAGIVGFVAAPLVRGRPRPVPDEAEGGRRETLEGRDRALAALRELEFDHRTGKITDEDYAALLGPLRRAAAEALQAVDP